MLRKIICVAVMSAIALFGANHSLAEEKDKILAKVGEISITQGYLDSITEDMPRQYRARWATPQGKKTLLQRIIDIKLFSQEARRLRLDKDQGIKAKIENMTERVLSSEYVRHLTAKIDIGEDQLKHYFETHQSEFEQPEQIRARHILVKTQEEAEAIQKELKAGKDFAQLAEDKSTCPSKRRGGDLGWFGHGKMAPEFEEVAFKLKKGEVSGIVHTNFGYHIIKLEGRRENVPKTFDEVRARIKMKLQQQREREVIDEAKARLRNKAKVEVFEEAPK